MTTEHTPLVLKETETKRSFPATNMFRNNNLVAVIYGDLENKHADIARLFAAAPDLLEACQAALTVINTCVPVDARVPIPGISPLLRDAIAKAQEER